MRADRCAIGEGPERGSGSCPETPEFRTGTPGRRRAPGGTRRRGRVDACESRARTRATCGGMRPPGTPMSLGGAEGLGRSDRGAGDEGTPAPAVGPRRDDGSAGRRVGGTTGRRDDGSAGPACSTGRKQASDSRFAGAYAALHGRSSASRGPATPSRRLVCSPGPRRLRGAEPAMEELIIDRGRRVVRPVSRPRTFDPPACRPTGERTRETSIQDPGSIGRGRFMSGTRACVRGGTGCPRP
jgi:hypothetical protein